MAVQLLDPWCDVADLGPDIAATFERVLAREVAPGHPLYAIPVAAVGKHGGCDDVLFRLLDGSGWVAVVHLTWTQSPPERLPLPVTELFSSAEAFAKQWMAPDHMEFIA